jgi:hypothetical protein
MSIVAHLVTALLFGGMTLFSFGFAAFVFTALPPHVARTTIRLAFPHFYLFVAGTAAVAAALLYTTDPLGAALLAAVAATTVPTRQTLMPAINRATDAGEASRFKLLHSLSVAITLCHIVITAYVLSRIGKSIV